MTEPHDLELPPELAARIRLGDPTLVCAHKVTSAKLSLIEITPDSQTPMVSSNDVIYNKIRGRRVFAEAFDLNTRLAGVHAHVLHWVDSTNVVFVEP